MITPKQCVDSILCDLLNGQTTTFTGGPHKMMAGFFTTMDEKQINETYLKAFKK